MRRWSFHKGHGTGNDFVIFDDSYGMQELHAEFIRAICDRRTGIGADGVIRVVRGSRIHDWDGEPEVWFMDYYNADGSVAEMCGNGLRVFGRFLINEQLVDTLGFSVGTRAGLKWVEMERQGLISVDLGAAKLFDDVLRVQHGGHDWPAVKVDVGNPHAVVFVTGQELASLELLYPPTWEPAETYPEGANVEFVCIEEPGRLTMRVFERGVGETRSCGTGVVAAAAAYRGRSGYADPIRVSVPGGDLLVTFDADEARLTGPAVIVGRGEYWF